MPHRRRAGRALSFVRERRRKAPFEPCLKPHAVFYRMRGAAWRPAANEIMAIRIEDAIVLRITEFSETSQVVWFLTAGSGQVRLLAKGVRRATKQKASVGLDLLERGELSYAPARQHADLGTLTEWTLREGHLGLRRSLPHLLAGLYAADLLAAFAQEEDPAPALFQTTTRYLEVLAGEASGAAQPLSDAVLARLASLVLRFQRRLLEAVGFMPQFEACADCGRRPAAGATFFSSTRGGLLCRDCAPQHEDRRRLPAGAMPTGSEGDARPWVAVLDDHLSAVLGRPRVTSKRLRAAILRRSAE